MVKLSSVFWLVLNDAGSMTWCLDVSVLAFDKFILNDNILTVLYLGFPKDVLICPKVMARVSGV